jgi:two-component system, NarL family, nitrate/nitrite response regulator NarL
MADQYKSRAPIKRKSASQRRDGHLDRKRAFGVLLATSNEILREGLRSMIAQCGFRVFVCPVADRVFASDNLTVQKCRIFVVDASDDLDCSRTKEFVALIRERNANAHIVILIPPHLAPGFDSTLVADASAIVTTDVTAYILGNMLQLVSQNYVIRSTKLAVEPSSGPPKVYDGTVPILHAEPLSAIDIKTFPGLSTREREILLHVIRGSSNKVIARALGIAEATVKIHVKGIFRKIGVANRTQAAFYVFNQGWLGGETTSLPDFALPSPPPTNCFPTGLDIIVPRHMLR